MGATVLNFADAATCPDPAPVVGPLGRPRLTLVPTGRDAARAARADRPQLRVTRFGRLMVTMAVTAVVVALAIGLTGQLASAAGGSRPVTVESGQTLSEIAARELPELTVNEGVIALQLENAMNTDQVSAGQQLLVPTP